MYLLNIIILYYIFEVFIEIWIDMKSVSMEERLHKVPLHTVRDNYELKPMSDKKKILRKKIDVAIFLLNLSQHSRDYLELLVFFE